MTSYRNKPLTIGIILLFVGTNITPLVSSELTLGNTIITVDDEPGDADYTSIKEALNHSNPGDTIEVYSGTYNESNITIMIPNLTLKGIPNELGDGNDSGKPIIDIPYQWYNLLIIKVDNISIIGFKIISSQGDYGPRTVWVSNVKHFYFTNNEILITKETLVEVMVISKSTYITIQNNLVDGGQNQLYIQESHNCRILNNTFVNSDFGITLIGSNMTVSHNLINNSNEALAIVGSNFNLTQNIIYNCGYGILVEMGSHIVIDRNELRNNSCGVAFLDTRAFSTKVTRNNIIRNNMDAIIVGSSIFFSNFIFRENYWSRPHILPKLILGFGIVLLPFPGEVPIGIPIPWFCFDWHPAQEPFDIPGMS
ncbi:MAG: right-handed parallel beta-helix repeat-containing protein [Candidatus Thermoplasmatota archaeon]|jgi:parallel beta-helix repeat protein|nr:right-handed parallel beta-helix repeat-containing protein [Candidatus Thermoplasmatota archaeon]